MGRWANDMSKGVHVEKIASNILAGSSVRLLTVEKGPAGMRVYWTKPGATARSRRDTESSFKLSELKQVTSGRETALLQRRGKSKYEDRYISLVTSERTLDLLTSNTETAQALVRGFELLMKHPSACIAKFAESDDLA